MKNTKQNRKHENDQHSAESAADDQNEANDNLILAVNRAQRLLESTEAARKHAKTQLETLRQIERERHATAEFWERLLGMVGHDLRNPLAAVSISIQSLILENKLREDHAKQLCFIQKTLQRMDRLIYQLCDFTCARLGLGVQRGLEPTDIRSACQTAIEELKVTSPVSIQEEFYGDTTGTWVIERMVEALSNLIGNALDHATKGTAIVVKAYGEGDEVMVEVVNQGPPIPPSLIPVLFVAFHRGASDFEARPGHLGLGLFISHEIVRAHGGTLTAQCSGGVTTFTMRLPRSWRPASQGGSSFLHSSHPG